MFANAFPVTNRVVPDHAHESAGERWQARQRFGVQQREGVAKCVHRRSGGGHTMRCCAKPACFTGVGRQQRTRSHPDEGVARPHASVFGGFEEEGAGLLFREFAIQPDRRLGVSEDATNHRNNASAFESQCTESMEVGRCNAEWLTHDRHQATRRRRSSCDHRCGRRHPLDRRRTAPHRRRNQPALHARAGLHPTLRP